MTTTVLGAPTEATTLVAALNAALRTSMAEDPRVVVMGEDVGTLGGVFRVTDGLAAEFGRKRVIDTPLAESAIVGTAIGLALRGYRPVCEIQFDGFVYPAFDQIVSQLAKMRARTNGLIALPLVIRIPVGGGIGAVEHHSESNEAYFAHTAGLRVAACSDSHDGYHMLKAAIANNDPVVFYEPKRRYWEKGTIASEDDLPLDRARVLVEGTDCTVISYGPATATALGAAQAAAEDGVSLGVIDLRSLSPLDLETLRGQASRTGRVVVVHEASTFAGLGAEVAAAITEECFYDLHAPVQRVGAYHVPYPAARIEDEFLPSVDRVLHAVQRTLDF